MHLVNAAQFLDINFLLELFTAASASAVLGTLIFPLTYIYASLYTHTLEINVTLGAIRST